MFSSIHWSLLTLFFRRPIYWIHQFSRPIKSSSRLYFGTIGYYQNKVHIVCMCVRSFCDKSNSKWPCNNLITEEHMTDLYSSPSTHGEKGGSISWLCPEQQQPPWLSWQSPHLPGTAWVLKASGSCPARTQWGYLWAGSAPWWPPLTNLGK